MDTRGARELAKRLADEERRRAESAGEDIASVDAGIIGAVKRLQEELASLRTELAGRDDAIARLRMELTELRATTIGTERSSADEKPPDEAATRHVLFVSGPSAYGLLLREGRAPEVGSEMILSDWAEGRYRVCKVGRSPLPSDRRRCAFLERLP